MSKTHQNIYDHPAILNACQKIANLVGCSCSVPATLLIQQNLDSLEVVIASHHARNPYAPGVSTARGHGLYCETVLSSHHPLHVTDATQDPDWSDHLDVQMGMVSYFGVPVYWPDGKLFGTFCVLDSNPKHYTEHQQRMVREFAEVIETLLAYVVSFERMEFLATHDALTGCMSRGAFLEKLKAELLRMKRYSRPVSLLFLDVDHFKAINDQHGHAMGDQVLARLAECIESNCRETDFVGRLGGEEFGVCLPETTLDGAREHAERLRRAVEQSRLADIDLHVTISIGVALTMEGETIDTLLARADAALYLAKDRGRNQVVTAAPAGAVAATP